MKKYIFVCFLLFLSACQGFQIPLQVQEIPRQALQASTHLNLNADTGRSFMLAIKKKTPSGFGLKYVFSEVSHLRVWLVSNNTGTLTPVTGYFDLPVSFTGSGDTQTVFFDNVPAGSFYVAAAALNSSAMNLTENQANPANVAGEPVYVSQGGGEFPANPGRITVGAAPTYLVTGTATLTLQLVLD
jgi:hypothetical protein